MFWTVLQKELVHNNSILLLRIDIKWLNVEYQKKIMPDQKPLFKSPYDIRDVSALFAIVGFVLIIAAIVGNNLFGIFQQNVNFT